ncbi:MAG: Asp-tRNA(Asn)/Glu-tRNA(Gln) amidotransferase subunit GatC [Candidatus Magasanikbacteria bacterium]
MKLTAQKIEEIAKLARLDLTEKEKTLYADQLSAVLDYVEQLNEVNTDNVPETCQVTGLKNVTRADEPVTCDDDTRAKIIAAFPEKLDKVLKVKAVFESTSE